VAGSNASFTAEALLQRPRPCSSPVDRSRVLEAAVIPRLHRSAARSAGVAERDIVALADSLLKQDLHNAWGLVKQSYDAGMDAEQIAVELLGPVARHLGELWVADRCSFTDVTLGTGYLHQLLRDLATFLDHGAKIPGYHHRVLLLPAPGEQHILGLSILGESFRRRGWDVCGGPVQDRNAMLQMLGREHFDVIGFSVSADRWIDALSLEIERGRQRSRNPRLLIMVGGHAIQTRPELVAQLGADISVSDARLAPDTALALLEESNPDSC
jgi:MerR family transcriptional regulator, light-induced transcriptional regulator